MTNDLAFIAPFDSFTSADRPQSISPEPLSYTDNTKLYNVPWDFMTLKTARTSRTLLAVHCSSMRRARWHGRMWCSYSLPPGHPQKPNLQTSKLLCPRAGRHGEIFLYIINISIHRRKSNAKNVPRCLRFLRASHADCILTFVFNCLSFRDLFIFYSLYYRYQYTMGGLTKLYLAFTGDSHFIEALLSRPNLPYYR